MNIKYEKCAECHEDADYGMVDGVWLCNICAGFHGLVAS